MTIQAHLDAAEVSWLEELVAAASQKWGSSADARRAWTDASLALHRLGLHPVLGGRWPAAEALIAAEKALRDVHEFQYDSAACYCSKPDNSVCAALAQIAKLKEE